MPSVRASAIAITFAVVGASSASAVPTTMTYAAVLKDSGAPVNTTVDVTFAIFDAAVGGTQLYSETQSALVILNGDLVTEIGQDALDDTVLNAPSIFLAVNVDGDDFSPRVRLSSVPYALRAQKAASAATADVADALGSLAESDVVTQAQLVTLHLDQGLAAGSGLTLSGGTLSIANGAITNAMIADGSVTTAKIGDSQVTSAKIADGTIANVDISATAAITGSKLASGSVTTTEIQDGTIKDVDVSTSAAINGNKLLSASVTKSRMSGGVVQLNQGPAACGSPVTPSSTCSTLGCIIIATGNPGFFNCSGICTFSSPTTCSTTSIGFLIGPTAAN